MFKNQHQSVYNNRQNLKKAKRNFTSILARFIEPRSIRTGLSSSSRRTFVGFRSLSSDNKHIGCVEMSAGLLV